VDAAEHALAVISGFINVLNTNSELYQKAKKAFASGYDDLNSMSPLSHI
jgi:hypothetical protein